MLQTSDSDQRVGAIKVVVKCIQGALTSDAFLRNFGGLPKRFADVAELADAPD
ncbi:MAG: hypothetical protein ACR2NZ_19100 [Rubripirellula sp.]